MSRQEHDREDLLGEATAFADRAEFEIAGRASPVFIGIRPQGAGSIYFDPDRVYHFNQQHELRRAFLAGLLYKASGGALVSLARRRSESETVLASHELPVAATSSFLDQMAVEIARFARQLEAGEARCIGQVTSESTAARGETAVDRIRAWLNALPHEFKLAASPRV